MCMAPHSAKMVGRALSVPLGHILRAWANRVGTAFKSVPHLHHTPPLPHVA